MLRITRRMSTVLWALGLAIGMYACSPSDSGPASGDASEQPTEALPPAPPSPSPAPARPALVVDLHLDTVTEMAEQNITWNDPKLEAPLPELLAAGVNVVVQAAWIPRGDPNPRGTGIGKIRRIRNMVRQSKGKAALVTGPDQLERVVADGRIAVIIALEGGTALTAGEETLREFRALGLSMLGLTWSESSPYADSSAEPRAGDSGGLTGAGRDMVRLANDLGLLLDVSHMSDRATAEVIALSRAPVLASHSNSKAVCDVPRNLSDDLLSRIAKQGGLVGAMFHGPFVVSGRPSSRSDVANQIRQLVDRVGADHVALGSDWDGKIKAPAGLSGPRHLSDLRAELAASGLSEGQLRKIWGENFLRFWRSVEAARAGSD